MVTKVVSGNSGAISQEGRAHGVECGHNDIDASARQVAQGQLKCSWIQRLEELRLDAEFFRRHIQSGDHAVNRSVVAGELGGNKRHPHRIVLSLRRAEGKG